MQEVLRKAGLTGLPYEVKFTVPEYEVGYGFLPCPDALTKRETFETEYKDAFRMGLYAEGEGSKTNPFVIRTTEQWSLFAENASQKDYMDKYVSLETSLKLNTVNPIGSVENPFRGNLNGNGEYLTYTVTSLQNNVGLFSCLQGATITDLHLGGYVISSGNYVGFLAGFVQDRCTLQRVDVLNEGTSSQMRYSVNGQNDVGGILGGTSENAVVELIDCSNASNVGGNERVGGIVGSLQGTLTINGVRNQGKVTSAKVGNDVGGLFGYTVGDEHSTFRNLSNSGSVAAEKTTAVGGIFGKIRFGQAVLSVASTASVIGRYDVGAVFGEAEGDILLSAVSVLSTVTGVNTLGGVVGNVLAGSLSVEDGYFSGSFVRDTSVKTETFDTGILGNGSVSASGDFFYNGDVYLGNATNGVTAKSTTDLTFGTKTWDAAVWKASLSSLTAGYYPVLLHEEDVSIYKNTVFSAGKGTEAEPFLLANEQQLRIFGEIYNNYASEKDAYCVENGLTELHFRQTKDISLSRPFFVIEEFSGFYDGGNYAVKNLSITSDAAEVALFGTLTAEGTIMAMNVGGTVTGQDGSVAALVAENYGTVTKCLSLVKVTGNETVGGLVGKNYASVVACLVYAVLSGKNGGGIVADNEGTVDGCAFGGVLRSELADACLGGIASYNRGTIKYCSVNPYMYSSYGILGGLVGKNEQDASKIIACLSDAVLEYGTGVIVGGIVGTYLSGTISEGSDCSYYNVETAPSVLPYAGFGQENKFGRTTTQIRNSTVNNLEQSDFLTGNNGYNDKFDAYYTFIPKKIGEWYRESHSLSVREYAQKVSEIPLWGYDYESDKERGTEGNPYRITSSAGLGVLSDTVAKKYSYAGKYFVLTKDVDMTEYGYFTPIGKYSGIHDNYGFNGNFNGQFHTISHLSIKKDTDAVGQYIALFGYTGSSFVLKNLILDSSCTVSGKQNVASLVGYFQGKIQECRSSAKITAAEGGAGGLIGGLVTSGSSMTDSLFDGTLTGTSYGLVGEELRSSTAFVTTNTWFVTQDTSYSTDTAYGNAVVEYKNDDWKIVIGRQDGKAGYSFSFALTGASSVYKPLLGEIQGEAGTAYYLKGNAQDTVSVHYCQKVSIDADVDVLNFTILEAKSVYFYTGQTVSFRLSWKSAGDYLKNEVVFDTGSPEAIGNKISQAGTGTDDMVLTFTMFDVLTDTLAVHVFVAEIGGGVAYTGDTSSTYSANPVYFDETALTVTDMDYVLSYYHNGTTVQSMQAVGTYTVRLGLRWSGENVSIGRKDFSYEITRKTLHLQGVAGSDIGKKSYDGQSTLDTVLDLAFIDGLVDSEVEVQVTVTWYTKEEAIYTAHAESAEGLYFTVGAFVLSGAAGKNYLLEEVTPTVYYTGGVISPLEVRVNIDGAENPSEKLYVFSATYSGKKPTAPTVYGAKANWTYQKVSEDGTEDGTWTENKGYPVGYYRVTPALTDTKNYVLTGTDEEYRIQVMPKEITSSDITYLGLDTLTYTGEKLASKVTATYRGVNAGENIAVLTYYVRTDAGVYVQKADGTDFVLATEEGGIRYEKADLQNAGQYYMTTKEKVGDNYVLHCAIVTVEVAKATVTSSDFTFTLNSQSSSLTFAYGTDILVEDTLAAYHYQQYDVQFIARAGSRGEVSVLQKADKWYLHAVSYGESIRFRLKASVSENYADVVSLTEFTVTITPVTVYVGLKYPQQVYGDEITLEPAYFASKNPLESLSGTIDGLKAPVISTGDTLPTEAGKYSLYYSGGSSDGYVFEPVHDTLEILPKTVYVSVPSGLVNGKQYGEADAPLQYIVYDDEDCKTVLDLPEGTVLAGSLARQQGEEAGSYEIFAGTMETAENRNYTVLFRDGGGRYTIEQRDVYLVVRAGQNKAYGEGNFPLVLDVAEGYAMAKGEKTTLFTTEKNGKRMVTVTRMQGEAVGYYDYQISVDYLYAGESNYNILGVTASDRFYIGKATPVLTYTVERTVYFGDAASVLPVYNAKAMVGGREIDGTFTWENASITKMVKTNFRLTFAPADTDCYRNASIAVSVLPEKRIVTARMEGETRFVYDGLSHNDGLTVTLDNTVAGVNDYTIKKSIVGDTKNVSEEGFTVSYSLESDYYVLNTALPASVQCHILPAVITVSVANIVAEEGEEIKPVLTYSGFVNRENESVLRKKASVPNLPSVSGIYAMIPEGASAQNYTFCYTSGVLCINTALLEGENVSLEGSFSPTTEVCFTEVPTESDAFADIAETINKKLGDNLFLPLSSEMTAYYTFSSNTVLSEDSYGYTFFLNAAVGEKDTIYVRNREGELSEITDFDLHDDGMTITFESGEITCLAVYSPKETTDLILDYIPLTAAVLAVLFFVGMITAIVYFKKHKAKKDVYRAVKGTYYDFPHRKK